MQNKVLVYTAIFGDKDDPPSLLNWDKTDITKFDFLCITDNPKLQSPFYKMYYVKQRFSDTAKNARYYKICGHPDQDKYDTVIWHDSSLVLNADKISELANYADRFSLSTFKHGHSCIYPEARQCIEMERDHPLRIAFQVWYYAWILKYPLKKGVYETGILVKNTSQFNQSPFQKVWWKHVKLFSRRDQLSLPVAKWLTQSEVGILEGKAFSNHYSIYRGHRYYNYFSRSLLSKINFPIFKKLGAWITYKAEKLLATEASQSV